MKRAAATFLISVGLALGLALAPAPTAVASTVQGRIVYQNGAPIPGITVYVVHPSVGRSAPATTDSDGRFSIPNVPPQQTPFYVEVYWGRTLKYRKALEVTAPRVAVPDIPL
ncbi:MAG: carboxypeptidase-like regulatory domain-containing protein [Casimicrobiaceae bacterium]